MGKVTGLAHIGVKVKDVKTSIKFYTEMLGFKVDASFDMGKMQLGFLSNGTCLLELIGSGADFEASGVPVVDHICVEVEDIEGLVADLKAKGIVFDGEINNVNLFGGVKNIFFKGPDGERIEFFDYMR